jgi:hypothetical protein
LLVLVHKEVPEADDKTSGECLSLTHGVGGGQQGQGLQEPHLQIQKYKSLGLNQANKEVKRYSTVVVT